MIASNLHIVIDRAPISNKTSWRWRLMANRGITVVTIATGEQLSAHRSVVRRHAREFLRLIGLPDALIEERGK